MSRTGSIHAAILENSPRLQRALKTLEKYPEGLTTRQWQSKANLCNAHTCAAELRENLKKKGLTVSCNPEGRSTQGSNLYRYRLASLPADNKNFLPISQPQISNNTSELKKSLTTKGSAING